MSLLTSDQEAVRKMVQEFAHKEIAPHAAHYDKTEEFPWDNIKKMGELGLMGLPIPEQYGGAETDMLSYVLAIEEISKACAATGCIICDSYLGDRFAAPCCSEPKNSGKSTCWPWRQAKRSALRLSQNLTPVPTPRE